MILKGSTDNTNLIPPQYTNTLRTPSSSKPVCSKAISQTCCKAKAPVVVVAVVALAILVIAHPAAVVAVAVDASECDCNNAIQLSNHGVCAYIF